MTIDFLPSSPTSRSVSHLLMDSLSNCLSVQGSVAFWKLPTDVLDRQLFWALCRPESFICVDFHIPTNFEYLAEFVEQIRSHRDFPSLFIFLRKAGKSNDGDSPVMLHTKILLFDMGNQNWQIWVGSHNFTRSALFGLNLEGSLCVKGNNNEPQFTELLAKIKSYLIYIQSLCEPFDPNRIPVYKALRGEKEENDTDDSIVRRILTLQSEYAHSLAEQTIIMLGNLPEELGVISRKNRGSSPIFLRIRDVETKKEYTYKAYLRATDYVDNVASFDVIFNQRRWVFREVTTKGQEITPPLLKATQNVGPELIGKSRYYVNIEIIELMNDGRKVSYFTHPETNTDNLWEPVRRFTDKAPTFTADYHVPIWETDASFTYQVPAECGRTHLDFANRMDRRFQRWNPGKADCCV